MTPYYQDNHVTIYHADCRDVLPHLEPVDLVLTDPPYGHGDKWKGGTWASAQMYEEAQEWDKHPVEQTTINKVIKAARLSIVWGGNYYQMIPSRCWLAWEKIEKMDTLADFELAWTNMDRPAKQYSTRRNIDGKREHPTQKPVRLMRWCIEQADHYVKQQTILDPFMGSGTTLRAAKDLGRKAIGIEIEEKYCEIAARRMSQEVLPL